LWRRASSQRLLILLDDAADAEQIRPLMPSGAGSIMLVTTRNHLTNLPDALRHALPLMSKPDARDLFLRTARLPPTDDPAVDSVVTMCGRLPLALSIAGAFLSMHRSWNIADLAEHMIRSLASQESDTFGARLDTTFDTSYRDLADLPRRILRRLALYPGPRVNLHAAAALADASPSDADLALTILVDHHLLTEPQRHQYRMHDLIRGFASRALAREETGDEQRAASDRLLQFTLATVETAAAIFHPHRQVNLAADLTTLPSQYAPTFNDAAQAAAWLDGEQVSLRAALQYWHENERSHEAAALAHLLAEYFDQRSLWKESIRIHENALATWARRNDRTGQAHALTDLANAHWRLVALEQARVCCDAAFDLWRTLGDTGGKADALLRLGRVHFTSHRYANAIDCFQQAADLRRADHDKHGQAVSLYHLGMAVFEAGQYNMGIAHTQRALELARTIRDIGVERNCINNLGEFHSQCGDYPPAEACYQQALTLSQQLGDTRNIALAALNLGDVHTRQYRPDTALPLLDRALETFHKLEDQYSETSTLLAQARAYLQLDQEQKARTLLDRATILAEQIGNPSQLANAQLTAGAVHLAYKDHNAALQAYKGALSSARKGSRQLLQAAAHHGIGDSLDAAGKRAAARNHWRHALSLYDPVRTKEVEILRARLNTSGAASS
jgi:tetratricopeptide (TPR) repeat protein